MYIGYPLENEKAELPRDRCSTNEVTPSGEKKKIRFVDMKITFAEEGVRRVL